MNNPSLPPPPNPAGFATSPVYVVAQQDPWPAQQPTISGLGIATSILMWVSVVMLVGFSVAARFRRDAITADRVGDAFDLNDISTAMLGFSVMAMTAAMILVSLWTRSAFGRLEQRGMTATRPGLGCGSWYIPFGNIVVPFVLLYRVLRRLQRTLIAAVVWQIGFGVLFIGGLVAGAFLSDDETFLIELALDPERLAARADVLWWCSIVVATSAILAAIGATLTIRTIDRASTS